MRHRPAEGKIHIKDLVRQVELNPSREIGAHTGQYSPLENAVELLEIAERTLGASMTDDLQESARMCVTFSISHIARYTREHATDTALTGGVYQ